MLEAVHRSRIAVEKVARVTLKKAALDTQGLFVLSTCQPLGSETRPGPNRTGT